jgi:hypothetical protein
MAKMSDKELKSLTEKLSTANELLATKFYSLYQTSLGTKGGHKNTQAAMSQWGPLATMMAKMYSTHAIKGMPSMQNLKLTDVVHMIAAEEVGGNTSEEIRTLKRIADSASGLEINAKEILAIEDADERKAAMDKFNKTHKEQGVTLGTDKNGKQGLIGKDGNLMKGFMDYMGNLADKFDTNALKEAFNEDREVAKIIAEKTTDIGKILEQGVERTLGWIYETITGISDYLFGLDKTEQKNKKDLLGQRVTH